MDKPEIDQKQTHKLEDYTQTEGESLPKSINGETKQLPKRWQKFVSTDENPFG